MLGLEKLKFISPERRQGIQLLAVVITTALMIGGVIQADQVNHLMVLLAAVVQAIAAIINMVNLDKTSAAKFFITGLRGFIYTSSPVLAAAGVGLGFFTESAVPTILMWTSLVLTAIGAVVAIVFSVPAKELDPNGATDDL